MSGSPALSDVAQTLAAASAGDRLWFWCSPGADAPLLLSAMREDPRMSELTRRISAADASPFAPQILGIASVGADGRLSFGGRGMDAEALAGIARWAAEGFAQERDLARLKDAECVELDGAGTVLARHADPGLWSALPDPPRPGTMQQTRSRLQKLPLQAPCWFWMTAGGPGGQPFLAFASARSDPDASQFAASVAEIERRCPAPGPALRGTLVLQADGALVLTTDQPLEGGAFLLSALRDLPRFDRARLVRVQGGRDTESAEADPDRFALCQQLAALKEDEDSAWFWFAPGHDPLLAPSREDLAGQIPEMDDSTPTIRGKVSPTKDGWLHFQAAGADPAACEALLPALAELFRESRGDWPPLARLRDARLTLRSKDGEILSRYRDDDAW